MEIEIKIIIKPRHTDSSDFNKRELISDLKWQFREITGYEMDSIEVNEL